jgi:hypothetical protein
LTRHAVDPATALVKSFELDCKSVGHGSSGAPVFNAETGAVLGLVWTGVCLPADGVRCRGPISVTAASAWKSEHAARPPAQRARLDALLREHGLQ